MQSWQGILTILKHGGALKELRRQGWIDRGVSEPESVADHSYRVSLLVLILATMTPGIDPARAVVLALVHDLPESIAGDATPFDERLAGAQEAPEEIFRSEPVYSTEAKQAKHRAEEVAMEHIVEDLPPNLAEFFLMAWREYETGETAEARLVRQADKIETMLQALEYQQRQPEIVIDSFITGTRTAVTDSSLRELVQTIEDQFQRS